MTISAPFATTVGETVYGKMRRLAATAKVANPHLLNPATGAPTVMTSPPTVSQSTSNALAAGTAFNLASNSGCFYETGGPRVSVGSNFAYPATTPFSSGSGNILSNPPRSQIGSRISFMADAIIVVIAVINGTNFRLLVNDQYVSLAAYTAAASNPSFCKLDFTSVGGRANRKITLELIFNAQWGGAVYVGSTETVSGLPSGDRLRATFFGDSITGAPGATVGGDGYAMVAGDYLGISDIWMSGVGGTGYQATNSAADYSFPQRVPYDIAGIGLPFDAIFFVGGVNDIGSTATAVTGLQSCISLVRAWNAAIPIFVCGVWSQCGSGGLANSQTLETALLAAASASGDPNIICVPISNAADGAVMTGIGATGSLSGSGNADVYITAAPHPNTLGHQYCGMRLAAATLSAIAGKK
jgi:hypothetical protein